MKNSKNTSHLVDFLEGTDDGFEITASSTTLCFTYQAFITQQ